MDFGLLDENLAKIKVFGVGGAGNNAINRMSTYGIEGVEFWACNTDYQILNKTRTDNRILLGPEVTHGLGAGANPNIGLEAANASYDAIKNAVRGANMVFIAAGMGGGTGTGASPIVAKICKDLGILTVAIVTRPFSFEGKTRNINAVEGLQKLRPFVDSLIVVNNDQLLEIKGNDPFETAFDAADDILCKSVKTITDLILKPGIINRDFADVETVMRNKGTALIGMGEGYGVDKAITAASNAVTSPLLETSIKGAKQAIVHVEGGSKTTLLEINTAVEAIRESCADQDVNIIFGFAKDESLGDGMRVIVIATEFSGDMHGKVETIDDVVKVEEISDIDALDEEDEDDDDSLFGEKDGVESSSPIPSFFRKKKNKKNRRR